MEALFQEMIDTLSQAQLAAQEELGSLLALPGQDSERLSRLARTVGELSGQSDGLFVMILEQHAPGEMLDTAQTLVDFFHETMDQITDQLIAVQT